MSSLCVLCSFDISTKDEELNYVTLLDTSTV